MIHLHWFKEGETPNEALPLIRECGVVPEESPFARMACLVDERGECVAVGRLAFFGGYLSDYIYVKKNERGKGYGDFIARAVIEKALYHKAQLVRVLAKNQDVGFYTRFGFGLVSQAGDVAVLEAQASAIELTCGACAHG